MIHFTAAAGPRGGIFITVNSMLEFRQKEQRLFFD